MVPLYNLYVYIVGNCLSDTFATWFVLNWCPKTVAQLCPQIINDNIPRSIFDQKQTLLGNIWKLNRSYFAHFLRTFNSIWKRKIAFWLIFVKKVHHDILFSVVIYHVTCPICLVWPRKKAVTVWIMGPNSQTIFHHNVNSIEISFCFRSISYGNKYLHMPWQPSCHGMCKIL